MRNCLQLLIFVLFVLPKTIFADVKLNTIFSDRMVVQQDVEIPIWGWADAGEKVTVNASWGAQGSVVTGADGKWKVTIKTPKAGGPFKITVKGRNSITINDVLSGEVWLCTGQSNMDFALEKFVRDSREPQYQPLVEYIRNEVATAEDDWLRHIEVPQTTSLFDKKLNFQGSWRSVNPNEIGKITATGYFFAKELRKKLNVPVGLLECSWGGTRIQPWISEATYFEDENMKAYFEASRKESLETIKIMDAKDYVDKAYEKKLAKWKANNKKGRKPKAPKHPTEDMQLPATLHNGMLSSIIPYAIKGAIWYQGESNAVFMPDEYEAYFTAMIKSWRAEWNQGDFPFYWVQLAACQRANEEADNGWAVVNDKLRRTLKLENTGMAVLNDIGEAKDIHPHNKMDAGKRLALWALKKDYNIEVPAVSGPLYKTMKIEENKIEVAFTEIGSGLMVGRKNLLEDAIEVDEPLNWFEVKGNKGVWEQAEAKIISDNTIEVWSEKVSNPTHVRYAWTGNPEGVNFYNKEGLPAASFTTE